MPSGSLSPVTDAATTFGLLSAMCRIVLDRAVGGQARRGEEGRDGRTRGPPNPYQRSSRAGSGCGTVVRKEKEGGISVRPLSSVDEYGDTLVGVPAIGSVTGASSLCHSSATTAR